MGRAPRIQDPGLHYHVIARCNNRAFHFEIEDFEIYLGLLAKFRRKHQFKLFNYELMHSHVHLFLQPSPTVSLAKTIHAIHWAFANDANKRKRRQGHFWMGRYKSIPVENDEHALTLMRYINRNAVRAGIASKPGDWRFSGYRFYAEGESNDLIEAHPSYLGLAPDAATRQKYYQRYVLQILPTDDARSSHLSASRFIGSARFGRKLGF